MSSSKLCYPTIQAQRSDATFERNENARSAATPHSSATRMRGAQRRHNYERSEELQGVKRRHK